MLWTILIWGIIVLDQLTKIYVRNNLLLHQRNEVITNFFSFTHVENAGAAFGILQNGRYFFIVLTLVLVCVFILMMLRNRSKMMRLSLSLIIAGALGNWLDRLLRGSVTDFLDFNLFGYNYPVFNVADISVNVGTGLLFIYILFVYKEPKPAQEKPSEEIDDVRLAELGDSTNAD